MTKFKKEYNHKVEDIVEACGMNEEDFQEMLMRGVDIWENNNCMSKMVEQIENYSHEYDSKVLHRFLIMHFISYIMLKNKSHSESILHKILSGTVKPNEDGVTVYKETESGELEHVDTLTKLSNPELHEKLTEHACVKCHKKDACPTFNKDKKEEPDGIIKH